MLCISLSSELFLTLLHGYNDCTLMSIFLIHVFSLNILYFSTWYLDARLYLTNTTVLTDQAFWCWARNPSGLPDMFHFSPAIKSSLRGDIWSWTWVICSYTTLFAVLIGELLQCDIHGVRPFVMAIVRLMNYSAHVWFQPNPGCKRLKDDFSFWNVFVSADSRRRQGNVHSLVCCVQSLSWM